MKKIILLSAAVFLLFLISSCQTENKTAETPATAVIIPYPDASLPPAERAQELLAQMTLAEKVGQMTQIERAYLERVTDIADYKLGSLLSGGGSTPFRNTPVGWADMIDGFQNQALRTRLRIPLLYGTDAVHGHNNMRGATIFPHNIGLGATRNPELVEEVARITAIETTATGVHWNFAPSIAVPRNIRWGRTYEGYSEDPELTAILGAAAVRGYQGDDISAPDRFIATAKHFVGDGGTLEGKDQGDTQVSIDVLRDVHARPYIDAIEAGARTVMASYNSWNGEKLHGSRELLTDMLRGELGFDGLILSDWGAVKQLPGEREDQIERAIMAGIDMVMVPDDYQVFIPTLIGLVESGRVPMERIDDAVMRILTLKFEFGLFESPKADRSAADSIGSPEHREVARQAVRESLVLLKNDNIVPISSDVQHIHLIGNKAHDIGVQSGGWTITWQGSTGPSTPGTTLLDAVRSIGEERGFAVSHGNSIPDTADLVILVVGEEPYAEFEGDTEKPELNNRDLGYHRTAVESGLPVLSIMFSGRPMIITDLIDDWDAFAAAWLPGTEAAGITDIIFGAYEPSGVLPITWPRSMRLYELREQAGGDPDFEDPASEVLFPFGFGL